MDVYIKQTQEDFGNGKKKEDQIRVLEPKEQYAGEFPGFSFCLIDPRLALQLESKAAREKQEATYKGALMRLAVDFSTETLQARRE